MTVPSAIESPVVLYATFPRRLLAMLVDGFVLFTYQLLLLFVGGCPYRPMPLWGLEL